MCPKKWGFGKTVGDSTQSSASTCAEDMQSNGSETEIIRTGPGQPGVKIGGHNERSSGVHGVSEGLIVVNLNGEGRGVASRTLKPKEMK